MMKTRFAPSPTGLMHFGNLRTALFNFLLAKKEKGTFLLRIEDTDQIRSKPEYTKCLLNDLHKTMLDYQEGPYFQSERGEIYEKYYKILLENKQAYYCFCSEQQLAISRKLQLSKGLPPRYSGTCRNLSNEEIKKKLNEGEKPTLRFMMSKDDPIEFVDLIKGKQRFLSKDIGDFIIRRADNSPSFMFTNAIDDSLMEVTCALRGEDHLTNSPRQIMILKALGLPIPDYGHFPLIYGQDGAPLSKRNGSCAVSELLEQGYLSKGLINYLARLGHYFQDQNLLSLDELASKFNLSNISTSFAKHDISHLKHWQKEAMLALNVEELLSYIKQFLPKDVPTEKQLEFARIIQPNLLLINDVKDWIDIFFTNTLNYSTESKKILNDSECEFFEYAYEFLDSKSSSNEINFSDLTTALKNKFDIKGKKLFKPLRVALTNLDYGPEMGDILKFIGIEAAKSRFKNVAKLIAS